ncbi:helix-turn-helix transcriptional regulator [Silvimonas amylolytica]|uniref:LuxR family transcriptional regulator n=1 Tax=Silvimonas amylolytica TaxID=449663 RepID=A0ABQ2PN60_9NEIS|nr:helix-turn-helix transcriptional regulator [Silvimonas amylolytica]GGP26861.1 LuxR family transcriptional regulator [Silvimonas amylolytica]
MNDVQPLSTHVPLDDDRLIHHLYEAVIDANGFQSFIDTFRAFFNLKSAGIVIRHADGHTVKNLWLSELSEEWMSRYVDYAGEDMLARHIMTAPIAHFYASNLDLPNPERLPETRFFREWVAAQGMACAAGGVVLQEGPWTTMLFLHRGPDHPPFSREEMIRANRLVPHLQRAFQMRQRFGEQQNAVELLSGGLAVLAMPTFLFNEHQQAIYYNRSAEQLLANQNDLRLDGGRLLARQRPLTHKLDLAISNAVRASQGNSADLNGLVLLPRANRQPLMLLASPLRMHTVQATQGAALLFAFDPETHRGIAVEMVGQLFALSEAEAELAVALCSGSTLAETADLRGTSINTVKSQLKNIFLKTGTKRQSDLVSLLLASPAYFVRSESNLK